jgi:CPA1 family monovalent cation:H+ antiporter
VPQRASGPGDTDVRAEAAAHLLDVYRRRLEYGDPSGENAADMQKLLEADRHLRREALEAERKELFALFRANAIDDSVFERLVREIDLMESSLRAAAH